MNCMYQCEVCSGTGSQVMPEFHLKSRQMRSESSVYTNDRKCSGMCVKSSRPSTRRKTE